MTADASSPSPPPTRAQRQRETREALIGAARLVFARDGYHGANLETIANEAGFSKGAVYSNFASKAELFLAVMDRDLAAMRDDERWDPLHPLDLLERGDLHELESMREFALATLEFVATAARDDTLAGELRERIQVLLDGYGRVAAAERSEHEQLPVGQVATLLAALDQGTSLLLLGGVGTIDADLLRTGLQRLLDPRGATGE